MIKKEDFSPELLNSYLLTLNSIGKDETWGETALQLKSLEEWRKFGFGLFRNQGFISQVNSKMKGYDALTPDLVLEIADKDIENIKEEIKSLKGVMNNILQENKSRQNQNTPEERLNRVEERVEKMASYLNAVKPEIEEALNAIKQFKSKIDQVEKIVSKPVGKNYDLEIMELNRRLYALENGENNE